MPVPSSRVLKIFPVLYVVLAGSVFAREFSVVTYNVENLFDADGVAVYEDYQPEHYTPEHLAVKVGNIAEVLARIPGGPDVIALNEIELDQTPESTVRDYDAWLDSVKDKKVADLIGSAGLPESSAGLPAEAWLLKALSDAGLKGYHVAATDEKPGTYKDGRGIAVHNAILSRFPITSVRTHPTPNARAILEVVLDVDGHPLTVFSNHWKSGAGDVESEAVRLENAKTLKARMDEILAADPNADILVTGDLNSHYNQKRRYRAMKSTGINDVLDAQGNELALRGKDTELYNLWFELPSNNRGSDIYKNEWGTLLHMILSRGLYDQNGVQYVDNSFQVMKIPGLNADVYGRPIRWSRSKNPGGFSDHFPISARFRTVDDGDKSRWMALNKPSVSEAESDAPIPVETSPVNLFDTALKTAELPPETALRDGSYNGRVFFVEGPASIDERGIAHVVVLGQDYEIFTHDKDLRPAIREQIRKDSRVSFYGELGTYRGRWQFVLHGKEWFPSKSAGAE
ncbi:MAG: endonuclease/exonuclease/phosphatase family protein [Chthoniobacterales bacterium]|nr:endonuclease/exonuclease/phosphatase family protein [Chthoniobacterales bacterium]